MHIYTPATTTTLIGRLFCLYLIKLIMNSFSLTDIVVYEGAITIYANIKKYIDMVYFNNCQVDIDIRLANDEEIKRYNERP